MANTIRIKRRASGNAGAPESLENAELAYNEVDNTLYYGKGTGGAGGTATTVEAIAGAGAYVTKATSQTISGAKTFSESVTFSNTVSLGGSATATTQTSGNNSTAVATTAYVDAAVVAAGAFSFNLGSYAVASGDTIQIVGGTGLTATITDVSSTTTATLDLDNTTVTAGSYGSASAIPTFTVDAQGRLTAAGTASISTSFTVDADSGDNLTISGGDTFTIVGGTGLTSVASATDTLTINLDNTAVTAGSYGGAAKVGTFTVDAQGRLTSAGETTIEIALGTNTSGSYVSSLVAGTGVTLSNNSGEGATPTIAIGQSVATNASPSFNGLNLNAGGTIVFEGTTEDLHETTLSAGDPTGDRTLTLPDASGTIALTSDITTAVNAVPTTFTVAGDSGSNQTITVGSDIITIAGGTGLSSVAGVTDTVTINLDNTAVTAGSYGSSTEVTSITVDAQGRLTSASNTSIRTATTSQTGLASFSSADFAVSTGEVTIKSGGVDNAQLANSTITLGSSTLTLGQTTTSVAGITELTVDNMNFNGNEISTTDTNGNLSLNPAGTGSVTVNGHKITNLGTPVDDADAATKGYVDNKVTGLSWKQAVHALASSNVPLTGSTPLEIDGHTLLDGERVLLTGQTTATQKGIYVVGISGGSYTLTRSSDADVYTELHGLAVFVQIGTSYANTGWVQTTDNLTDFSGQAWVQFSGAGAYGAGSGLSLDGTTFNVNVDANGGIEISGDSLLLKSTVAGDGLTLTSGVLAVVGTADRITASANAIDIASTYVGQSSITTLGTIGTGVWQGTVVGPTYGGTGVNNGSSTITLGGNLTTSGANSLTLTTTGTTNVTVPTTGTLATLAGSETLSSKTITGSSIGSSSPSTAAFTTLTASGATTLTANTASSSYSTGTLVVTGGIGVSGALYGNSSTLSGFVVDGGTF